MTKAIIPPTPSKADYTQNPDYIRQAEGNAAEIFDRKNPFDLFSEWMAQARETELNDSNAMALATVDAQGLPDVRMVLLKSVDEHGFCFYTNNQSVKGQQLSGNGKAALCFHWKSLRRQVRVRGQVSAVSAAEADAYFASRARGSQLGAWSSHQSRICADRAELESKVEQVRARFEGKDITRPPHWGGWRVSAQNIEFWRDRPYRLHDRMEFIRDMDKGGIDRGWTVRRLYP